MKLTIKGDIDGLDLCGLLNAMVRAGDGTGVTRPDDEQLHRDVIGCLAALMKSGLCRLEIFQAMMNERSHNVSPVCCNIIRSISGQCRSNITPLFVLENQDFRIDLTAQIYN